MAGLPTCPIPPCACGDELWAIIQLECTDRDANGNLINCPDIVPVDLGPVCFPSGSVEGGCVDAQGLPCSPTDVCNQALNTLDAALAEYIAAGGNPILGVSLHCGAPIIQPCDPATQNCCPPGYTPDALTGFCLRPGTPPTIPTPAACTLGHAPPCARGEGLNIQGCCVPDPPTPKTLIPIVNLGIPTPLESIAVTACNCDTQAEFEELAL